MFRRTIHYIDAKEIHLLQSRFCQRSTIYFRRRYTSNFIYKSPWNLPFETVRVSETQILFYEFSYGPCPSIVWSRSLEDLWSPEKNDLRSYGRQFVTVFLPSFHVSDRFWINRRRRTFYPEGSKMDDVDDGCLSLTRRFESVLFNPREIQSNLW